MVYIRSANPDFDQIEGPKNDPPYTHGAQVRRSFVPMAFQVTSPLNSRRVLLPHALVLHVNPANYSENHTKKVERFQTRGGWVEQHWGDDLSEISADGSTGAFMNVYTGLSSVMRRNTIACDRFRDLHDLFHNNGSVYDPYGNVVLQGNIMLMYDRGTYIGVFATFEFEETAESPFAFRVSWTFKVRETILKLPMSMGFMGPPVRTPEFQGWNALAVQKPLPVNEPVPVPSSSASSQTSQQTAKANDAIGKNPVGKNPPAASGPAVKAPGPSSGSSTPQDKQIPTQSTPEPPPQSRAPQPPPGYYQQGGQWFDAAGNPASWGG